MLVRLTLRNDMERNLGFSLQYSGRRDITFLKCFHQKCGSHAVRVRNLTFVISNSVIGLTRSISYIQLFNKDDLKLIYPIVPGKKFAAFGGYIILCQLISFVVTE